MNQSNHFMTSFETLKTTFLSIHVSHARINLIYRYSDADLVVDYMGYIQRFDNICHEYNHLFEDSVFFQDIPAITENSPIDLIEKIIHYTNSMDQFKTTLRVFIQFQQTFYNDITSFINRQLSFVNEEEKKYNKPNLIFRNNDEKVVECGICYETTSEIGQFQCQHPFCIHCIEKLLEYDNLDCPLCRETISEIIMTTSNNHNNDKLLHYCCLQQTK